MSNNRRPLNSLKEGRWFKLICGASYQHLPAIRNLALVYGLAGADCIDVAADPAVVAAVKEAFRIISQIRNSEGMISFPGFSPPPDLPLLMVSFSDGEDPHFRKAVFDASACPADCPRPCETICPTAAIAFNGDNSGVIESRCYGCGRCLPVCPLQHIGTVTRATSPGAIAPQLLQQVDAIELHTQVGRYDAFMALWSVLQPYLDGLSLISISCLDHDGVIDYLWQLYEAMQPLSMPILWQTDGRSMSGDIGKGTTHATLRFGRKVLQAGPPGFVQLAGGTNAHTVHKLSELAGLTVHTGDCVCPPEPFSVDRADYPPPTFGGIAYGSFARRLLSPFLDVPALAQPASVSTASSLLSANHHALNHLETSPAHLTTAVQTARQLVEPLKTFPKTPDSPPSSRGGRGDPSLESPGSLHRYSSLFE